MRDDCPTIPDLEAFLLGRCDGPAAEALERHLAACSRCPARLEAVRAEDDMVAGMRARPPAWAGVVEPAVSDLIERLYTDWANPPKAEVK